MRTVVPKELQNLDTAFGNLGRYCLAELEVIRAFLENRLCDGWRKREGRK
jgi:hypothetical protein